MIVSPFPRSTEAGYPAGQQLQEVLFEATRCGYTGCGTSSCLTRLHVRHVYIIYIYINCMLIIVNLYTLNTILQFTYTVDEMM